MSIGGQKMKQTAKTVSPCSNEGRNTYVITHITDALLSLLEDNSINDISVSGLCEYAGVGRVSFYRNFESKEDILTMHIKELFSEWKDEYEKGSDKSLSKLVSLIFMHLEKHKDFYSLLSKRHLIYLIKDVILDICGPKADHSQIEAYTTAFVAYSLYGWIEVWFQRGMQDSAEEIVSLFKITNCPEQQGN